LDSLEVRPTEVFRNLSTLASLLVEYYRALLIITISLLSI